MARKRVVRPRWVWGGLAIALLGACLFAGWTATWRPVFGWSGGALLLVGGAVATRGGILYDTHGSGPVTDEIAAIRDGRVHDGTAPGDMVDDGDLRAEARDSARMTRTLIQANEEAARPPFDKLAAGLLLVAAVGLLAVQGVYPHTHTGQDNALRTLLLAAVIALAALRILLAQRPGAAPSLVAGLCGLALILLGVLTDHDSSTTVTLEIVAGAWVVLAALLSLDRLHEFPDSVGSPEKRRGDRATPQTRSRAIALTADAVLVGAAIAWLARSLRRSAPRRSH